MRQAETLFAKVWAAHAIVTREDGATLLWIDRHFVHEGSFHAFGMVDHAGRAVARRDLTFGVADHYVPSHSRALPIRDQEVAGMVERLRGNARRHGLDLLDLHDERQGIVHVVGPEQGLTLPGLTIVCGDSHTSTHGAFGALAFGIGASEVSHVLATQTLWQQRPPTMRITVDGTLGRGVAAKDLILTIIGRIGAGGAVRHVIEYAGSAIRALGMEARMTVCNMSIEAGARAGMIAPDDTTYQFIAGRPRAPRDLDAAVAAWRGLPSDPDALFDREVALHADEIAPTVTWGTSPETALPIGALVPDPAAEPNPARRTRIAEQLQYMGLRPASRWTASRSTACLSAAAPTPACPICAPRPTCCAGAGRRCRVWSWPGRCR